MTAIRQVLNFQARYNDTEPEDEWFGKRLYIMPGIKVASGLEGALAVENVYMEKPMGFHVQEMGDNLPAEVWEDHERRKKILEYCPELHTVLRAKLDRERCAGDTKDGGEFHKDGRQATSLTKLPLTHFQSYIPRQKRGSRRDSSSKPNKKRGGKPRKPL